MKNFNYFMGILITALIFSCNSNVQPKEDKGTILKEIPPTPHFRSSIKFSSPVLMNEAAGKEEIIADEDAAGSAQLQTQAYENKKKIIKDGFISIKTNDIVSGKKSIDALVKKFNGYYETEELTNEEREIAYNLKVRIPSENFEHLIAALENGKDEIKNKRINSRDVTEEYIDIEARLNQKHDYLKRYKELLAKASTVKDIIEVEDNIRKLQEEIESKEGRLKYLNNQISYSTLDINLFKEKEFIYQPEQQDNFFERVKKSLNNGWRAIVDFVLFIITIWPFILIALVVVYVVKRIRKKRKIK